METSRLPCPPSEVDAHIGRPDPRVMEGLRDLDGDVMVLGAGGKMGLHLALALKEGFRQLGKKNRVFAVSRFQSLRQGDEFERYGIETVPCDLSVREEVETLPECAEIFYLAGVKFGTSSSPELLERMNILAPRLVAGRFRRSRIVAFSTGCVYPFVEVDSGGSIEEDGLHPFGDYARSCLNREEEFTRGAERFGTLCTIVRLNYSIEFRYGVLVDIAEKVLRRQPVDVTMGYLNVIWQSDAVTYIIRSLTDASSPPFIINVTGPDTVSVRWLARRFGELFGREPIFEGMEERTAWLNNAGKAQKRYGGTRVGLEDMIGWTARWLKAGGVIWGKPTHFERRDGRF